MHTMDINEFKTLRCFWTLLFRKSRIFWFCPLCHLVNRFWCNPLTVVLLLSCRASLWSSCVVLPLLALTWMSAVLAITDRRSALFQILFAVFDSLEGFVIVMVHCILRREVGEPVQNLLELVFTFTWTHKINVRKKCSHVILMSV